MALILKDRVLETSTVTGTGTITLDGAVTDYQGFTSAIGAGNTTYYTITNPNTGEWEVGLGTVGTNTLTRDTVLSSSTGSKVSFTAGTKNVFCDYPASKAVAFDDNGNITTNCLFEGYVNQAASGTTIVLTAASAQNYQITGSGGQTIRLPNATTLPNGALFTFNNNQSSGTIIVQNNSSTTISTINSGGYVTVVLLDNSTAAGSWDKHDSTPSNVSWSTNTLDYAGSITSATWNGNTVAYNRGGTGQSSAFVAGGVVYGASTTAMGVTAIGTAGQVLQSNGASAPSWVTSPAAGAGGSNTQIQYNNSGVLAGNSTYTMVSGVMKENGYNFVSQADVGTSPSQIPLNQYLGSMAYEDKSGVILTGDATVNTLTVGLGKGSIATNTVIGNGALATNTTGNQSVALGYQAGNANLTGNTNLFAGYQAGLSSTGNNNVILGGSAGTLCTSTYNVIVGSNAGASLTSGGSNTIIGPLAGGNLTTGATNTYIGYTFASSASVSNEVVLGYNLVGKGANTAFIGGSSGAYNAANSATWAIISDARLKKNVVSLESGLDVISKLRPVEFDYIENNKHDIGFIAQEYQTILPAQISESADGMLSLNQNLVPYLVKAVQELSAEVKSLKEQLGTKQ